MTKPESVRAAIVTGGASGIGLATVERLIAAGWRAGALDRDGPALATLRSVHGGNVRTGTLDVTDESAADAAVQEMAAAFGRLDGLVNSAGIGLDKPALDTSVAEFRKVLDVNVIGTFIVGRAAARIMKQQGCGSIVNIASISGMRGSKGRAAYGASKGAVINLTQVMAVELARHDVRVNAIAPGPVDSPMVRQVHTPAVRRAYAHHVPMRRYGTSEEIAAAIVFLLDGRQSGYVTGAILPVDGGYAGAGLMEIED